MTNDGPSLPDAIPNDCSESMVPVRSVAIRTAPGLGLYRSPSPNYNGNVRAKIAATRPVVVRLPWRQHDGAIIVSISGAA